MLIRLNVNFFHIFYDYEITLSFTPLRLQELQIGHSKSRNSKGLSSVLKLIEEPVEGHGRVPLRYKEKVERSTTKCVKNI